METGTIKGRSLGVVRDQWSARWQHVSTALSIVATVTVMVVAVLLYRRGARGPTYVPPPLPKELLSIQGMPISGSDQAPFVLIVFSDFQCPFCRHFANAILPDIMKDYVAPGTIDVAFASMPLPAHAFADKAARAGLCASQQGRFWPMHDTLFKEPELSDGTIDDAARTVGLDQRQFLACVISAQARDLVKADLALARSLKVQGTPTFFVGAKTGGGIHALSRFLGASELREVKKHLDDAIKSGRQAQ